MEQNVNIIKDINGNNIVIVNDIRFKGRHSVQMGRKNEDAGYIRQLISFLHGLLLEDYESACIFRC